MNDKNLIPLNERTKTEQRNIARSGGIASGKARREKKSVQNILNDLLESKSGKIDLFRKLAGKLGVNQNKSVKELFVLTCLLNSVKNADLNDLEKLVAILGEDKVINNVGVDPSQEDALSAALREEAERMQGGANGDQ